MAQEEENLPLNKQVKRVKMYGTKNSQFHKHGEETLVDPSMTSHFEKRGLSLQKPEPEDDSEGNDENEE